MKYLALIFLLAFLTGCSRESKNQIDEKLNTNSVVYGTQLIESGFLKFADTLMVDALRSGLIHSFDLYNEHNNKIAHVDAEELAEFNVDFFMPRLNKILGKRLFRLNVQTADDYGNTNDIFINEERIKLYTKEELENGSFWEAASRNFFKEVNKQLSKEEIQESFYLLYEGNDLHVLLLTENQYKIIMDKYKNDAKEIPYVP